MNINKRGYLMVSETPRGTFTAVQGPTLVRAWIWWANFFDHKLPRGFPDTSHNPSKPNGTVIAARRQTRQRRHQTPVEVDVPPRSRRFGIWIQNPRPYAWCAARRAGCGRTARTSIRPMPTAGETEPIRRMAMRLALVPVGTGARQLYRLWRERRLHHPSSRHQGIKNWSR